MTRVLVVEDEQSLREPLVYLLKKKKASTLSKLMMAPRR